MVKNIGANGADSFFFPPNTSVPPVAKSLPPAAVNPATTGGASGVVPKGNDNNPDEFLSRNTAIGTANVNAGLISKGGKVNKDSNNLWSGVGAVEATVKEGGILSLLNTKGSPVSFVPVPEQEVREVQAGLVNASNGGNPNDAQRIFQIIENS
ncbi:MAG: hypothetical protein VKK32_09875 [Candidatus Melainabacteria bacterium]|nr:hypothetical protein [Candidatus Melainabacteria bacterium]